MAAHKKYKTMMEDIRNVGIECFLIREGPYRFKLITGNKTRTYRYRNSANNRISRIHDQEVKNPILIL